jgi:5-methylcytosine-specific restriction endonuclease McrA
MDDESANPVAPQQQLEFLSSIQRLLAEGQFTATYKYALLLVIADICVECGYDSAAPLEIRTEKIAEKFIDYYWPQSRPYGSTCLRQSTGKTPAVIRMLEQLAAYGSVGLNEFKRDTPSWATLVRSVDDEIQKMPLWKLQTVAALPLQFLYENRMHGSSIELKPGIMFCFRKFHELVTDLVRNAWVRKVRRLNANLLGASEDLDQFLFGAERASLEKYFPILDEVQKGKCLYCARGVTRGSAHIDHFIPWVRYPADLGHNFVLADKTCNSSKSDHLAASEHLQRWIERNHQAEKSLRDQFDGAHINHNLQSSERIANWAYSQALKARAMAWLRRDEFEPVSASYLDLFASVPRKPDSTAF